MKAIISSKRRAQIYENDLNWNDLLKFVKEHFPRMKDPQLSFKDNQGNMINIKSNDDLGKMKNIYHGQNFVEMLVQSSDKSGDH
jgi:hypothetical protein